VPKRRRVARHVPKPRRAVIHPADKWIALRTKLREARLREEGLVRAKKADFIHKALPAYTVEHPSKYDVVEQESDTPVDVPAAVTPKRESRHDHNDDDAETIDLRQLGTTLRFRDKQYGIRKEGNTLMIGNSVVELDKPVLSRLKGNSSSLQKDCGNC
jgi:hypothetical protein